MTKYRLEVSRCGLHPTFWAVCLSDESGGIRLTSSKCCGRWDGVSQRTGAATHKPPYVAWHMSPHELREAAEAFSNAADALESEAAIGAGERTHD